MYRRMHERLRTRAWDNINSLVVANQEDIGAAPISFAAAKAKGDSTAFLSIFQSHARPFEANQNVALIYAVSPHGKSRCLTRGRSPDRERTAEVKFSAQDFILEIFRTGADVMRLLLEYNRTCAKS